LLSTILARTLEGRSGLRPDGLDRTGVTLLPCSAQTGYTTQPTIGVIEYVTKQAPVFVVFDRPLLVHRATSRREKRRCSVAQWRTACGGGNAVRLSGRISGPAGIGGSLPAASFQANECFQRTNGQLRARRRSRRPPSDASSLEASLFRIAPMRSTIVSTVGR
jgi:hypothetical protein